MNFVSARNAMVESQLMPNGVVDQDILDAFLTVPRERFLPKKYQNTAYQDKDILLPESRMVLAPETLGKLICSLRLSSQDIVLCLGDVSGYVSAVLSMLSSTVVRVDSDPHALAFSDALYTELDIVNIVSIQGDITKGDQAHAPFDKIILCGASGEEPQVLVKQLSPSGVLSYVQKDDGFSSGKLISVERQDLGAHSVTVHDDVSAEYCLGYEPKKVFSL